MHVYIHTIKTFIFENAQKSFCTEHCKQYCYLIGQDLFWLFFFKFFKTVQGWGCLFIYRTLNWFFFISEITQISTRNSTHCLSRRSFTSSIELASFTWQICFCRPRKSTLWSPLSVMFSWVCSSTLAVFTRSRLAVTSKKSKCLCKMASIHWPRDVLHVV